MQKQVTPAMIVVALILLIIIIGLLWYFTMGRKQEATDQGPLMDPAMMNEPAEAGKEPLQPQPTESP